jgi:uncharacterized membrane protein
MIYISLLFVVTNAYFLSISEDKPLIVLHAMSSALNIMAVILHLSIK